MYNELIDAAILSHRAWISRLRAVLDNIDSHVDELESIQDYEACALGKWLGSEESYDALQRDFFTEVMKQHMIFHSLAGDIAAMVREQADQARVQEKFAELDMVSRRLVDLLESAKGDVPVS